MVSRWCRKREVAWQRAALHIQSRASEHKDHLALDAAQPECHWDASLLSLALFLKKLINMKRLIHHFSDSRERARAHILALTLNFDLFFSFYTPYWLAMKEIPEYPRETGASNKHSLAEQPEPCSTKNIFQKNIFLLVAFFHFLYLFRFSGEIPRHQHPRDLKMGIDGVLIESRRFENGREKRQLRETL